MVSLGDRQEVANIIIQHFQPGYKRGQAFTNDRISGMLEAARFSPEDITSLERTGSLDRASSAELLKTDSPPKGQTLKEHLHKNFLKGDDPGYRVKDEAAFKARLGALLKRVKEHQGETYRDGVLDDLPTLALQRFLDNALESLDNPFQKRILELGYALSKDGEGYHLNLVGPKLGIAQNVVFDLAREAIGKLAEVSRWGNLSFE